jgi:hypothetical protein
MLPMVVDHDSERHSDFDDKAGKYESIPEQFLAESH